MRVIASDYIPHVAGEGARLGDIVFDKNDNLYFFYKTTSGFHCIEFAASTNYSQWTNYPLTDVGGTLDHDYPSKHDRKRWIEEGILSFYLYRPD